MRKTVILCFILAFLISLGNPLYSQKDNLPENKYKDGTQLRSFLTQPGRSMKGLSLSIGYQGGQFLNPQYGLLSKEKFLKQRYGILVDFRKVLYPVIIDLGFFVTNFQNETSASGNPLVHRGIDIAVSTALLPLAFRISRLLVPYIGLGYQFSDVYETNSSGFSNTAFPKTSEIASSMHVWQPVWKTGLMINVVPRFIVNFEYRQSLMLNDEKALNQYNVSIGYRFGKNIHK
jgi:hypothetical protein